MQIPNKVLAYAGIDRLEMVDVCPFCGERLERLQGDTLTARAHAIDDCDPDEKLTHTLRFKESHGYYVTAVQDNDGDWWLFDLEMEYHEPFWYLRPIPPADLLKRTERAVEYFTNMLSSAQRTHQTLEARINGR